MASYAEVSEYSNLILDKYGAVLAKAFTQLGAEYTTVTSKTPLGRLAARGKIRVGGSGQASDRYVKEWGVDPAGKTAVAYGPNDTYTADSADTYGAASLEWKRAGIAMGWDALLNMLNLPTRTGEQPLGVRLMKRLDGILQKISNDLFTDGTGTSGKDWTGFRAFVSIANTYAGISQTANVYWRAQSENASSSALSATYLENLVGAMDDLGMIREGDTEMWMPRNQWLKFKALYTPYLRYEKGSGGGDDLKPIYSDGNGINIPIHIMGITNTEIWVVNPDLAGIEMVLADHSPAEEVPGAPGSTAVVHQGVPVGIKPIYNNTDIDSVWLRAFGNLTCENPRNNGYLYGLTA